jgi:hypothetical protein
MADAKLVNYTTLYILQTYRLNNEMQFSYRHFKNYDYLVYNSSLSNYMKKFFHIIN